MVKKALITGGAGFIGSALCEQLLAEGLNVCAVDDLSTGKLSNISHLLGNKSFEFVKDTVRNIQTIHPLIEKCDIVYHLAAAVGVNLIVDKPVHTIETNIHGTEVVLEAANKFNKKVVLASTSEVYGKSEKVPFCEDDDVVLGSTNHFRWSYACSKMIDEFLSLAYHRQFGLDVVIVRLFNTIGPRQSGQYGMVVPRFIKWALKNEPIQIYGDGKQSRCFCYVDDAVDTLAVLRERTDLSGEIFNVGGIEQISIEKLADKIVELAGSKSKKVFVPYEKAYGANFDDMQKRMPSIGKIKEAIGFEPKVDLDKAIEKTIEYFKVNEN